MLNLFLYILLGLCAGAVSGIVGIGGGIIIVPALVLVFGFTQQQAQGTTLALMIPPIGFLAAYTYFKQGFVDLKAALLICAGFFVGGLLGAKFAVNLSNAVLQKIFGSLLLIIGLYMIVKK